MAITATHLTTDVSVSGLSSYVTASISPTGNRLQLAWIFTQATTPVNTPTLSGCGITWVQVASVQIDTGKQLTLFRGLVVSPTSGAVTIDCGGQTQQEAGWSIIELAGVNTGGTNGSAALVQSATNTQPGASSLVVTLSAFSNVANAAVGGFHIRIGDTLVAGAGFTILGQAQAPADHSIGSEWQNANDTTVDMGWTNAVNAMGIAAEIAAAAAPLPPDEDFWNVPIVQPQEFLVSIW